MAAQDETSARDPSTADFEQSERVDRFGVIASGLCAIHCAVVALLPAILGSLGLGFLLGHQAEWIFTLIAIAFAALALVWGWRRHKSVAVAGLMALGILALLASRGIEMSGEHDEHGEAGEHGDAHADADEHGEDEAHGDHHEDEGAAHLMGTVVGVFGGLLIVGGHVLNLRKTRECRDDCA